MKLLALGATGGTGLQIVSQGIERGHFISRADVADFMIKLAENHASIGKVVGVSN